MIYINTVQTKQPMKEIKLERDFDFFKDYKPQRFDYPINEATEKAIKLFKMKIIIAGQMTGDLRRNNENVFSRSLLFIDFDDIHESEETFLSNVQDKLKGINYYLYPTLKYKADNLRYRLVIELDRPVNAGEYDKLLFGICLELGVNFTFDSSNKTWSQGQGAPVITQHSEHVSLVCNDGGVPIPTDVFLYKINNSKEYKKEVASRKSASFSLDYSTRYGDGKGKTIQLLEEVVQGIESGNRNAFFTRAFGILLRANMEIEAAIALMIDWNQYYVKPSLSEAELHAVMKSIVSRETKKERGD